MKTKYSFKAWAVINKETGRIMIAETDYPLIYMTKKRANKSKDSSERVIPVIVYSYYNMPKEKHA